MSIDTCAKLSNTYAIIFISFITMGYIFHIDVSHFYDNAARMGVSISRHLQAATPGPLETVIRQFG